MVKHEQAMRLKPRSIEEEEEHQQQWGLLENYWIYAYLYIVSLNGSPSRREKGVLPGQSGGNLDPDLAGWCTPVSYTHLDVYKRQVL